MSSLVVHFYPGHFPPTRLDPTTGAKFGAGLLVVLKGNTVLYRCPAWGGPSERVIDAVGVPATPTPAGTYVLRKPEPHTTSAWNMAKIRWGTPIKLDPADPTDFLYEKRPGLWMSARAAFGLQLTDVLRYHERLFGTRKMPPTWVFNPFGPLAVRFFKDLNNNSVLDAGEKLQGEMLHTTPELHAAADSTTVNPGNSHGCIHLTIEYRDALLGMGALKAGVKLVIHEYSEHYGSD